MVSDDEFIDAQRAALTALRRVDSVWAQIHAMGPTASTTSLAHLYEELEEASDHLKIESSRILQYLYALQGRAPTGS